MRRLPGRAKPGWSKLAEGRLSQSPRFGTPPGDSRSKDGACFGVHPSNKYSGNHVVEPPGTTPVDRHSSCDDEIEKGVASQNLTVQPDFDCHVEYRRTRAERRRWRPAGSKARLRRAGPGDLIGAMVAGSRPAAAPAEPGFCHASDRNRRAGPANAALVPGNGRRRAECLPCAPTPGSGCRHPDAANHLTTTVVICAYQD